MRNVQRICALCVHISLCVCVCVCDLLVIFPHSAGGHKSFWRTRTQANSRWGRLCCASAQREPHKRRHHIPHPTSATVNSFVQNIISMLRGVCVHQPFRKRSRIHTYTIIQCVQCLNCTGICAPLYHVGIVRAHVSQSRSPDDTHATCKSQIVLALRSPIATIITVSFECRHETRNHIISSASKPEC